MYDSNIAAWVVSTLTAVIAVGMIAPILSIYTYGPRNSGRIKPYPERPSIIAPELSTRHISNIHEKDIHHG